MSVIDSINKYMSTEADIIKELIELKNQEPHSDDAKTLILRGCICGYELGDIQRALLMNSRTGIDSNVRHGYLENGKLGMADLITQLRMICVTLGWSFKDIQDMGMTHLKERHVELDNDGWSE